MDVEDSFLAWLSTTRAKSKVNKSFLNSNESEIIQILGGMDNILNIVLSNKTFLNNNQFLLLSSLFEKEIKRLKLRKLKSITNKKSDKKQEIRISLISLPIDLTSYLCTFLDVKSLISFEMICYQILFIARKPSSLYQIDHDIMEKLNKYETIQNNYYLDLYRFTKAKKICITASKQNNNRFIENVIHKIGHSSMQTTISINELYLNSINSDNQPFESYFDETFSVSKLTIKDSHILFILNKCYDVINLELIDSAIDMECIPFIFNGKNRNNIKNIIFHDYRRKHIENHNEDNNDNDDDDIYLNQNGLFLKEFDGINLDLKGNKFQSIQCEGNLNLTKYFLYNILKLSFQSLQSLHIEELNLLNIDEYSNIYENMILSQLKELCFTCSVDEDIVDDFVLNADIQYFETPNLERLNIEITSFCADKLETASNNGDNNKFNNKFNIGRYLKIFGISSLKYLGINIEQNIDDDQTVLLCCLYGLIEYIKDVCLTDIIKLNINAEWFGEIDFVLFVQGIKNLIYTVDQNNNYLKLFVLSIGDLYFDINSNLINDLRHNIFEDLMSNHKWNIYEQIELFGNNTSKIVCSNTDKENHINWISQCHCCERPAFI